MEEHAIGRRERKKLATRTALSEAALRLSVERGVDQVTVEQIADEADVAVRTFFNYFSSKEEAVVAGDVSTSGSFVAEFLDRPSDEPVLEALRHAALAVVRGEAYRDRARVEEMRTVRRTPGLLPHQLAAYAEHERALAAAVAERGGPGATDLYAGLVAASVMAVLRLAVQRWLAEPAGSTDLGDLVDAAFTQLGAGLAAPVGR